MGRKESLFSRNRADVLFWKRIIYFFKKDEKMIFHQNINEKNKSFKLFVFIILAGLIFPVIFFLIKTNLHYNVGKYLVLQGISTRLGDAKTLKIGNTSVNMEVVDTPEAMEKGLGGRDNLNSGQGMLFEFSNDGKWGIWMKDMKFSIDIIWFDKFLKVVGMKENATPESFPEIFYPKTSASYVLEVPAGFVQKELIKINDRAEIFAK